MRERGIDNEILFLYIDIVNKCAVLSSFRSNCMNGNDLGTAKVLTWMIEFYIFRGKVLYVCI